MTKADREFVAVTSRETARDVVEQMLIKFPCKDNSEKLQNHDRILGNGLKDEVTRIKRWLWALLSTIMIYGIVDKIFF